jgi:hypothetical protein
VLITEHSIIAHYLGSFTQNCPSCHALHWIGEKQLKLMLEKHIFSKCCTGGDVDLPLLDLLPDELCTLYQGEHHKVREFREHICSYNKALNFTSTGGHNDLGSSFNGHRPLQYKIQGEIFHCLGSLLPDNDAQPRFSQLYIYNHAEALAFQNHLNPE